MEDEEDSLRVVGRVAKRDKDGNEITNESLGRGGARREDGTLSALVFDLETLPDDDDSLPYDDDFPPYDDDTSTEAPKLSPEQQLELFELFVRFLEVTVPVVQKAAPHVKRWWIERAAPAAKGKLSRITKRVRPPTEEADGQGSVVEPVDYSVSNSAEKFTDVDSVFEQPKISMSSAEWQRGFRAWMAATAVEEALRKMLANARIDDDDEGLLELQAATKNLTPQQRAVIANRVLEISPSSLDDEAFTKLVKIFGEGRIVDGQYVPVELEEPKEAARLTHGEM